MPAFAQDQPAAAPVKTAPLVQPGDIVALAAEHRGRWQQPKGSWEFQPDSLTGAGDCRIDFRGPFKPPFTVEFHLKVLKGMRPRVYFGPLRFANEGYERTFGLYPGNRDGVPVSYTENKEYAVTIEVERNGALLIVDGKKVMTASANIGELAEIGFSGGDWWSKGTTQFTNIYIRPRAEPAPPVAPAAPAEIAAPSSPLRDAFDKDEAMVTAERKVAQAKVVADYRNRLDELIREMREQRRGVIAGALLAEKARLDAGDEIKEERESSAPFEVLSARAVFLRERQRIESECDQKLTARVATYLGALEKAVGAAATPEDSAAALRLLTSERDRLAPGSADANAANIRRTQTAGGEGGGPFEEIGNGDELLTGLFVYTGDFAGHNVVVALQPIFRTGKNLRTGRMIGEPRGEGVKIEAREGYGIGGLNLNTGDRVDGFEAVFMKIKADGTGLDPADSYKSEWVGGRDGGPAQISGGGRSIVGIFGASGLELDRLGLVESLRSKATGQRRPAKIETDVRHANPAVVEVAGLTAEPLVESADPSSGKWQRVPEPFRDGMIFSSTPNKHLGVAEFKVVSSGRVYLACNYDYQGNSSGDWIEERWLPEDFLRRGWSKLEGYELTAWSGRRFIIFTREFEAGETGRLRCNKYEPPYFITFTP